MLIGMSAGTVRADVDFARDVQPVFEKHCYACHGPSKQKSSYRLDVRAVAFRGGDFSEPAIVRGNAAASPLLTYVEGAGDVVMPPKDSGQPPLDKTSVETLRRWIQEGAPWPDERSGERAQHWSLKPIVKPGIPAHTGHPIDAFVQQTLSAKSLKPSPPADRRTLIRRVTFDLTGLPPTPEEIEAFLGDSSPDAWNNVVERLLKSPHYGERWGRHWLDVARYTESQGFEYDRLRNNAWHYRDYVIKSFNDDKPYDQFIREQIAGDVLQPQTRDGIVATSLLVCGPYDQAGNKQANVTQRTITREEELEDLISVVGQSFLGLTINCARCHAHKFDPISHEEYYRIKSVFDGVLHGERPLATDVELNEAKSRIAQLDAEIKKLDTEIKAGAESSSEQPDPGRSDPAARKKQLEMEREECVRVTKDVTYAGTRQQPAPTKRFKRGNVTTPLEVVSAGALSAIDSLNSDFELAPEAPEADRRRKFAEWLSDPKNPLPPRVIVNRVWHWHFGQGLVSTPNDFGASGSPPSHPELLDWLAAQFIEQGWSLKSLHRLIVTSQTYRQSSQFDAAAAAVDSENRLLWRYAPRRLEGEAVRDAILAASGLLNRQLGGPGFRPFTTTEFNATFYHLVDRPEPEFNRRTVYRINVNSGKDPLLESLDCPDPSVKTPRRGITTTPLQALELMNNPFVQRQTAHLARRVADETGNDTERSIDRAYLLALGRSPTNAEMNRAKQAVQERGLTSVCWALLNSTEFIYVQ
jgi:hypothetical protein